MPKAKAQESKAHPDQEEATQAVANESIQSVLSFLADLGSSDAFQQLCSLKDLNESLRQQNAKSHTAYQENLQQLLRLEQTLAQERAAHADELKLEQASRATETANLQTAQDDLKKMRAELAQAQDTITDHSARVQDMISQTKANEKLNLDLEGEIRTLLADKSELADENTHLVKEAKELKKVEQSHLSLRSFLVELVPLQDRRSQMYAIRFPPLPFFS